MYVLLILFALQILNIFCTNADAYSIQFKAKACESVSIVIECLAQWSSSQHFQLKLSHRLHTRPFTTCPRPSHRPCWPTRGD